MIISFRKLTDNIEEYKQLHKWCSEEFVYEWFEQRILSYDEIITKYKNKLNKNEQELLIIMCDEKDIGLVQIYKYKYDIKLDYLNKFNNIYEYDLFIGIEEYLSKGLGAKIVNLVNDYIYSKYKADSIILRPFKRNIRAVKCYLKCGYELIDEYNGRDTLGNPEVISVLINKKL